MSLVLSLFPGIGLLDRAFEEEGFCVVRGPDLLWGGDVRTFHPPVGRFDGVIGGPPCQVFSILRNLNPRAGMKHGNLIPEFERCVAEAKPSWFVMENVRAAPAPVVPGYVVRSELLRDNWCGGETSRLRRISFGGAAASARCEVEPLVSVEPTSAVLAGSSVRTPVRIGGSGKTKRTWTPRSGHIERGSAEGWRRAVRLQGLPADYDLPGFKVGEKLRAIGNGVPLPMGRAIAKAVRRALATAEVAS